MAAIGLLPAAMSHGIGSESQRPLAIVIIGRSDRGDFLRPVRLPADCGESCMVTNAI